MNFWKYISNIGVSEDLNLNHVDMKRLMFFNQVLFTGLFATIFQVLIMWLFIKEQALVFLTIPLTSFISISLNNLGFFNISKKLFVFVVYAIGSYTTILIGGAGLYHLGAIVIFISSLVIFDIRKEVWTILLGVPFLLLSLSIGEFSWFGAPDFSNHPDLPIMRLASIVNLFIVSSILMVFILNLNYKNEEKLYSQNEELEDLVNKRTKVLLSQKEALEKQNNEKITLLQEVHHRVKNNLQIIVSLINLQVPKYKNKEVNDALLEIQGRVLSMSLVHQEMYETSDFTSIDLKSYITSLIENVKRLHVGSSFEYTLNFDEARSCNVETAIPIGLIFNEIIANFFKHVLSKTEASFSISLEKKQSNYRLLYNDNGNGFPLDYDKEKSESLGMNLIESLIEQVDGEFKFYNDHGAVYEFWIGFK